MERDVLNVQLFGTFTMNYKGNKIKINSNPGTKMMQLLQILLFYKEYGIKRVELLQYLFGDDDVTDMANNLRVTVFRLKKMLVAAGLPEGDYIRISKGVYHWDAPMETVTDVDEFKKLLEKSLDEQDEDVRMEEMKQLCDLYQGELLQGMANEEWVLYESSWFKDRYTSALKQVTSYLIKKEDYEEALRLSDAACIIYPFDEWQSVKIDCYIATDRYKEAYKEYEETTKKFFEELGVGPSEKMTKKFERMNSHVVHGYRDIYEMQKELVEETLELGAFYCTYPSFRDSYRLLSRMMERNGQSAYIMNCVLVDGKGNPMKETERLANMSDIFYDAVKHALRRGDMFTKLSNSQYLILLTGTNREDCSIVYKRIVDRFSRDHKTWSNYVIYDVTSLAN